MGLYFTGGSPLTSMASFHRVGHLQAIFNPDALHDSVDVVLDSLLGKVEKRCDLLICHSVTYERNNLLLPPGQPEFALDPPAWAIHLLLRKNFK